MTFCQRPRASDGFQAGFNLINWLFELTLNDQFAALQMMGEGCEAT